MSATLNDDADVVARAQARGYQLVQRELATGELAWTWLHRDQHRQPCFSTRREAIVYMADRLSLIAAFDRGA